jgi:hypothetical protein
MIAREERTIDLAGVKIEGLEGREKLTERQQRELERLRQKRDAAIQARERLIELDSGSDQKERYGGRAKWAKDFVVLGELKLTAANNQGNFKITDEEFQDRVIKALSWTPFMRFQRTFSKPRHYVCPHPVLQADGKVAFLDRRGTRLDERALRTLSVAGTILCPDRISTELAQSLRILTLTPGENLKPLELIKRKAEPGVIDGLKAIFDGGEFVEGTHCRVMVLGAPTDELDGRQVHAPSMTEGRAGSVLYFRYRADSVLRPVKGSGRGRGDWRTELPSYAQHFHTILKAQRRAAHATRSYDNEHRILAEVAADLNALLPSIKARWKSGGGVAGNQALLTAVSECLDTQMERLKVPADAGKRKAVDIMAGCRELRDSLSRLNPEGASNSLRAAISRLSKRATVVVAKSGYTEADRKEIRKLITAQSRVIVDLRGELGVIPPCDIPSSGRGGVFERRVEQLLPSVSRLNSLTTRPFSTFGRVLTHDVHELRQALTRRDPQGVRSALASMHLVCRCSSLAVGLSELSERLAVPEQNDGVSIYSFAAKVRQRAAATKLAFALPAPERKAFDGLLANMSELMRSLAPTRTMAPSERVTVYAEARERIDNILPERLVFTMLKARGQLQGWGAKHSHAGLR